MKIRPILLAPLAVLALIPITAAAQQVSQSANKGFSFAVYGDSRSMMYLPYKQSEEADARKLMVDMFALVLPGKGAPEVVAKDVKLIYDPTTQELVEMVMPFMTASEVTTLKFDEGWVTEASVEDVKLLPGVSRHDVPAGRRRLGRARDGAGRAARDGPTSFSAPVTWSGGGSRARNRPRTRTGSW